MRRMSELLAILVAACVTHPNTGNAPSGSRGGGCYELRSLAKPSVDDGSPRRRTFIRLDPTPIPGSERRDGTIHQDSLSAPEQFDLLWWNPHPDSLRMSTLT